MKKILIKIGINILCFMALVLILGAGFWGIKPAYHDVFTQIGYFRMSAFPIGLSVYQQDRPFFYNVSPFNDYYFDQNGYRNTFITKADLIYGNYQNDLDKKIWAGKYDYFLSLADRFSPSVTFSGRANLKYSSQINGGNILITREITGFPDLPQPLKTGLTLSYDCHDFVFDDKHDLYSLKTEQEIQSLADLTGFSLIKIEPPEGTVQPEWETIPGNHLFVFSPAIPGVIRINMEPNQNLMINRAYCLMAVEETPQQNGNKITDSMSLTILDNLKQVK
jgi:hypothetical protein